MSFVIRFVSQSTVVSAPRAGNPQTLLINDFTIEPLEDKAEQAQAQPLNPKLASFDTLYGYYETGRLSLMRIPPERFVFFKELAQSYIGQTISFDMAGTPQIDRDFTAKITSPIRFRRHGPRSQFMRTDINFRVVE